MSSWGSEKRFIFGHLVRLRCAFNLEISRAISMIVSRIAPLMTGHTGLSDHDLPWFHDKDGKFALFLSSDLSSWHLHLILKLSHKALR